MQSEPKQIYEITAARTGKSFELYKDVGTFVFASLSDHMRRPKSLIIKLRGVGYWYLRRKRMEIVLEHFPIDYGKEVEDFDSDLALLKYENKAEIHQIFKDRLKEYEEYIEVRDKIRSKRYETQILLEPLKREDKS